MQNKRNDADHKDGADVRCVVIAREIKTPSHSVLVRRPAGSWEQDTRAKQSDLQSTPWHAPNVWLCSWKNDSNS